MSDTAARARELAEALNKADLLTHQPYRGAASSETINKAAAVIEQLLAQSTPVEEVAREIFSAIDRETAKLASPYCTYMPPEQAVAEKLMESIAEVLRQHGYGAQGQGVGPRCSQCQSRNVNVLYNYAMSGKDSVECRNCKHEEFRLPVPAPESATENDHELGDPMWPAYQRYCKIAKPNPMPTYSGWLRMIAAKLEQESATKECLGYPKCDGNLIGEPHEEECPARESAEEKR